MNSSNSTFFSFSNKSDWIWIDCFSHLPLDEESYLRIKEANFKICLVSPELQGHKKENIKKFKLAIAKMEIEAVCTKFPELWK